ncbi:ribosomal protein S18-alanine N-acetyltransferase [Haloplanus salilacus]|uniref:ribosomal protein S18-alanine N-acetyltransferase n=1 Tax=Haloplanus salilacus TaxID=2949994 RepID=UPI0030CC61A9
MAVHTQPADVTIRDAETGDLGGVVRIERASFAQPWPYAAFDRFVDEPGFLVADRDGDVVGYVVGDVTPDFGRDLGHVKDLAVAPSDRRRGIGRTLLNRSLTALAVQGSDLVKLEVRAGNEAAQTLYRDVGFRATRRLSGYYRDGEDALVMMLHVPDWQDG